MIRCRTYIRDNPFYGYEPTRGMLAFHQSRHLRKLLRAPNQSGKTISCAYEAFAHLTGMHFARDDLRPAHGMAMIADLDNAYPIVSEKLREVAPMDLLDPATKYIEGKGWYTHGSRYILTREGKKLIFRGGEGSRMSAESATVGFLWIDEPPKQDRFGGAVSRVAVANGPVFMGFTPIARPCGYLKERVEGSADTGEPPSEEWVQFRPSLTEQDCTTISGRVIRNQASIDAQAAGMDPWEKAQRIYGEWEGISVGRKLIGFSERCVISASEAPRDFDRADGDELRHSMDHGQLTGKQVLTLQLWQRRKIFMLAETVFPANTGPITIAKEMIRQLGSLGLTVYHLTRIIGDANSAGFLGGGAKYNELIERELCDLLKTSRLPCEFAVPDKRRGSVDAGETVMSSAMRDGRYFVVDTCTSFIRAARLYTGKEEDLKNNIDAARYGVADLLLRTAQGATSSLTVL